MGYGSGQPYKNVLGHAHNTRVYVSTAGCMLTAKNMLTCCSGRSVQMHCDAMKLAHSLAAPTQLYTHCRLLATEKKRRSV
jgi:hypothetical protein